MPLTIKLLALLLLPATVTAALARTGAETVGDACTVSAWLLLVPTDMLLLAATGT